MNNKIFTKDGAPLLLPCHCCGSRHPLIVQYYIEAEDNIIYDKYVFFYYHLVHNNLLKRIGSAIRLVLGLKPRRGDFADIDLEVCDVIKLRDYLNQFLNYVEKATAFTKE